MAKESQEVFAHHDIQDLLEETYGLVSEYCQRKDVQLIKRPVTSVTLKCQGGQVSQAIGHLLKNAADAAYNSEQKWVEVSANVQGQHLVVEVKNPGIIVDTAILNQMFDPFFTTKDLSEGIGLGLGLAKKTAQAHGGDVNFSCEGQITTFLLSLGI
jgi:signal transduction histidine kinase